MQETQEIQVQSLGWEDPLEKEMATHSSIPTRKTPWTEEPGGLQTMKSQELDMTEHGAFHPKNRGVHIFFKCIWTFLWDTSYVKSQSKSQQIGKKLY